VCVEWIIEGGGELTVAVDAVSRALKRQGMTVPERGNLFCENGWQHGKIRPIRVYRVLFLSLIQ